MKHVDYSHPRTPRGYLRLYLTGFAMGAADIVPGVSGGTMAFILGIYETLLNAIKSFDLTAVRLLLARRFGALFDHISFRFLLAVGLGILTAIFALSSLLHSALETHPLFVFAFFGGLVIASIVGIGVNIRWNAATAIALIVGTVVAFWLVGLNPLETADHSPLVLFFSGMIAIMAMILPGISGSFILLILGQYQFVLGAVKSFDIVSIGALALGCVVGILGFARILSWLLRHHEQVTIAALVGFMIGSLRKIWMEVTAGAELMGGAGTTDIVLGIVLALAGFLLVSFIDHLQSRSNPVFVRFWKPSESTQAAADAQGTD